jgi:inosine/xanthosine triphosphate pyrophosphatase family protein
MDKVMLEYKREEYYEFSHRGKAMKSLIEMLKNENK